MKKIILYLCAFTAFGLGIFFTLNKGRTLSPPPATTPEFPVKSGDTSGAKPESSSLLSNLMENFHHPLTRLFVQMILILLAARICGALVTKIHEPAVIGEMIAGVLLGPSLLGWLWPDFFHFIFPAESMESLRLFSQIGVCLFMFIVGMELDVNHLKQQARTAVLVSQVSIFFPYLLGVITALFLYSTLAGPNTTFLTFALFIGISTSITAFPVLARILEERSMTKTALGTTAIACAAVGDVTAWIILAFVVTIAKAGNVASAAFSIAVVVGFVSLMLFFVRARLPNLLDHPARQNGATDKKVMASVLVILFASALATDVMGIHALFGSFLAGVIMPPRAEFRESLKHQLDNFSSVFLLPLFFAFTGLRTQIGLLNDASGWLICLGLIVVAMVGKLGGAMVTARMTGANWIDSFALGALMNTRGLVELIALNIGYDLGILSPRIFTMLVIMALVTTFLTGPLLSWCDYLRGKKPAPAS